MVKTINHPAPPAYLDLASLPRLNRPDFLFGSATAAFQIEGATHADGRIDSIWDQFCREPGRVANGDTGERACEHFRHWRSDLALVQALNLDAYRFSVAWPRIVGENGAINAKGLAFYDGIVDWLNERGIKPFLTLYHWDLPQYLQARGGWTTRETVDAYLFYVEAVSRHFGDRIYSYSTFNEPWCSAFLGHSIGVHAPGLRDMGAAYKAAHHLLLAHGRALPILRANAPLALHGIVVNGSPLDPARDDAAHHHAAELAYSEGVRLFLDPILRGHYPEALLKVRGHLLPKGFEQDLADIHARLDYLGLNYYSRNRIRPGQDGALFEVEPLPPTAPRTAMGWGINPEGLTMWLQQLARDYELPPIYITENGAAFDDQLIDGQVDDVERCEYLNTHLAAVDRAMQSGVDVRGYFAWSLLDNFEWAEGYRKRFGIVYVDYASQQRTVKASGEMLALALQKRRTRQHGVTATG